MKTISRIAYSNDKRNRTRSIPVSYTHLSEYPNYELNMFYGSVSEIINGLENNKLDFGFIIENSNDILKDEYCSLSFQIKQSVITPGSVDIAVHPINTIEKPARVIWQNDINCMKGLFVEKLRDFSERFLLRCV